MLGNELCETIRKFNSLRSDPEFVVVGAGLAGLAAASVLHKAGKETLVLEASDSVGGRVRTDSESGFLLDRGFQVLLTAYPELKRHLDLPALDLQPFLRGAAVLDDGHFVELVDPRSAPLSLGTALTTSVLTSGDRLRLLPLVARIRFSSHGILDRETDCETGEFLRNLGFSEKSINAVWEPLLGGIQLTPSLQGSARLACLILRCLILGPAAVPAAGMQAIPDQIASGLPSGYIRLSTTAKALNGSQILLSDGTTLAPRKLVLATDGRSAAELLKLEPESNRGQWYAYFTAPVSPSESRAIHLFPAGDGPCSNLAVMSNVAPAYAPAGQTLITVAGPAVSREPPLIEALAQLRRVFGPQAETWQLLKAGVVLDAQPVFGPGKALVTRNEWRSEVVVAGDHRATPSIQGALVSGRLAAESAMSS